MQAFFLSPDFCPCKTGVRLPDVRHLHTPRKEKLAGYLYQWRRMMFGNAVGYPANWRGLQALRHRAKNSNSVPVKTTTCKEDRGGFQKTERPKKSTNLSGHEPALPQCSH